TLSGEAFNLDELPAELQAVYSEVKSFYDTNIDWTEFTNLWMSKIREVFSNVKPSVIVEEPLYKICQDLDSRLGIRQGYTREPDYRDLLADIISLHYKSRYQFCKEIGVDEGYLSSVLNKKKNLSLEKLQEILNRTNYRIVFIEKAKERVTK
ncbi:MAG: hypothetical protein HY663_04025, partial [Chloroflexi bacterium]|nr:hypothetical protein [Chloroflexota bacterium]